MKRILLALLVPASAYAQVPGMYPNPNAGTAPTTLDPGASGNQTPPAPQQAPAQPRKPDVVVVKPDGTMTFSGDQPAQENGYYANSGDVVAPTEPEQEGTEHFGPVPELHVVRHGDTLWDICNYYFNDPWQWPRVWSYNPQITNPHWIYPGDLVRLLPRGVFETQANTPAEPEQPKGPVAERPATDVVPAPARKLEVGLKQVAFVEKADLDKSITIDGAVDEKVLLGTGDQVYLSYPPNRPPEVGKRYSIYTPDHDVKGYGAYVHILGTVEVVSVKQDKRARGVIVEANQEIERGAKVGPLVKTYKTVPPQAPKVDAQGSIVAILDPAQLVGQGELVFIDLGAKSGVEVGNRMFVVRRGDALPPKMDKTVGQDDRRFPARALGEIVIVDVGQKIAVGLVTLAVQEMGVGDLVMMQKAE